MKISLQELSDSEIMEVAHLLTGFRSGRRHLDPRKFGRLDRCKYVKSLAPAEEVEAAMLIVLTRRGCKGDREPHGSFTAATQEIARAVVSELRNVIREEVRAMLAARFGGPQRFLEGPTGQRANPRGRGDRLQPNCNQGASDGPEAGASAERKTA